MKDKPSKKRKTEASEKEPQPELHDLTRRVLMAGVGAAALAYDEAQAFLDRLVRRGGVSVLYTHVGKIRDSVVPFEPPTVISLRRLAERAHRGEILVTTTRRLLGYCRARSELSVAASRDGEGYRFALRRSGLQLETASPSRPGELAGLTVYTEDPERTRVTLGGEEVTALRRNGPDHMGRRSVSLPWPNLEFPDL